MKQLKQIRSGVTKSFTSKTFCDLMTNSKQQYQQSLNTIVNHLISNDYSKFNSFNILQQYGRNGIPLITYVKTFDTETVGLPSNNNITDYTATNVKLFLETNVASIKFNSRLGRTQQLEDPSNQMTEVTQPTLGEYMSSNTAYTPQLNNILIREIEALKRTLSNLQAAKTKGLIQFHGNRVMEIDILIYSLTTTLASFNAILVLSKDYASRQEMFKPTNAHVLVKEHSDKALSEHGEPTIFENPGHWINYLAQNFDIFNTSVPRLEHELEEVTTYIKFLNLKLDKLNLWDSRYRSASNKIIDSALLNLHYEGTNSGATDILKTSLESHLVDFAQLVKKENLLSSFNYSKDLEQGLGKLELLYSVELLKESMLQNESLGLETHIVKKKLTLYFNYLDTQLNYLQSEFQFDSFEIDFLTYINTKIIAGSKNTVEDRVNLFKSKVALLQQNTSIENLYTIGFDLLLLTLQRPNKYATSLARYTTIINFNMLFKKAIINLEAVIFRRVVSIPQFLERTNLEEWNESSSKWGSFKTALTNKLNYIVNKNNFSKEYSINKTAILSRLAAQQVFETRENPGIYGNVLLYVFICSACDVNQGLLHEIYHNDQDLIDGLETALVTELYKLVKEMTYLVVSERLKEVEEAAQKLDQAKLHFQAVTHRLNDSVSQPGFIPLQLGQAIPLPSAAYDEGGPSNEAGGTMPRRGPSFEVEGADSDRSGSDRGANINTAAAGGPPNKQNQVKFSKPVSIKNRCLKVKKNSGFPESSQLEGINLGSGNTAVIHLVSEQAIGYSKVGIGNPGSCRRSGLDGAFFTALAGHMASSSQPVRSIKNIPTVVELSAKTTNASTLQGVVSQARVEEAPVLQRLEEPVLKTGESLIKNWEAGCASHRLSDADMYLDSPSCHTEDFPSPPNHTISEDVLIARAIERDFPDPPNHTVSGAGVLVPPIEAKFDNNSSLGSISLQFQALDQNGLYNIISNSVSSYITYSDVKNPGEGKLKSLNSDYFGVIDNYQNFIISFDNQLIVLIGSPITLMLYFIEYIATLASISLGFAILSALFKPILNSLSEELKVSVAPVKDGVLGALSLYSDIFLLVSGIKAFIHADLWFGMRIGFLVGLKHKSCFLAIYSSVFKDTDGVLVSQYSQYKKENIKELTYLYNIGLD